MTDIAPIKGVIELQDDYTGEIDKATAATEKYKSTSQASFAAVAQAAALVTAAIAATAYAVYELGLRGSAVNDVASTMDRFAGSSENAAAIMEALRKGTRNTVTDFDLMSKAAHVLSTGVKLTAEDFGVLGEAAFVLQDRGLGDTKEMMDLVSDALVTGKTKALAMKVGVIDLGDAEQRYAETLGVTKQELSDTGRAEAHRLQVMEILNKVSKDSASIQKDFGDRVAEAKVKVGNFVDSLASAVDASPVLAAAMDTIGTAVSEAFGDSQATAVQTVMGWIEQAAIVAVDFGLGAIELARVVGVAWSAIKTVILGVETVIVGLVDAVVEAMAVVADVAESLHIIPEGAAQEIKDVRTQLRAMTVDLAEQTVEAAKGVVGHTEFDKTLDNLGGTLFTIKDAMVKASEAARADAAAVGEAAAQTDGLVESSEELNASMIDREKLFLIEEKSIKETMAVWNEYNALLAEHGLSSFEAQKAQIQAWLDNEVAKLDESDRNWQAHYDALQALAGEKLRGIEVDWGTLREKSLDTLREQARIAYNTYNEMVRHANHFTREALQEQYEKVRETQDAVRGLGKDFLEAQSKAAEATERATAAVEAQSKALKEAAEASRQMGGSTDINRGNLAQNAAYWKIPETVAFAAAARGFSFEEIVQAWQAGMINSWVPRGPKIPGFKEGGMVDIMTGEEGPEVVRVPLGSTVFPTASLGGDVIQHNVFHVNGTAIDVARQIKKIIMGELKATRQFGAA